MMKQATLLALMMLAFLTGCEQQKPTTAPPAQPPAAEPAPPAQTPPAASTPGPAEAPPPSAPPAAAQGAGTRVAQADGKGKAVYDSACVACHGTGVAGAPKLGDKAAWAPRIAQGMETLYTHSLKGFQGKTGVMPPKGGFANLSDAEVKAAVDYMVSKAK